MNDPNYDEFTNIQVPSSELLEDTDVDPVVEGVTFFVKYLGSSVVVKPSGEEATADAIRAIVSMVTIRPPICHTNKSTSGDFYRTTWHLSLNITNDK